MLSYSQDKTYNLCIYHNEVLQDKLSAKLDNEVDISLKLSINFILYVIVLPLSTPSLIGPEKVIYFSAFSPKQSN